MDVIAIHVMTLSSRNNYRVVGRNAVEIGPTRPR